VVEPAHTVPDTALLDATRRGEEAGFAALYERYAVTARKVAHRAGVRPCDLDDVVADTWARLLRAIRGGRGPTDNFPGYLATTIRRVAWAHSQHHATVLLPDHEGTLDSVWHDELPESIADTELGRALRDLPPSWREVIWRVEVVGEKVAAIAAEQGRSANSVSATASRARRRLRDLLENPREGLAGVA
jgi:RNA polymerase sigma factor (sigma-70 family)